jgi:DnaJ homolog subfamily C member 7
MAGRKDLYKILEVTRDADQDDIRKAYRKMALKYHPDKQGGKTEAEIEAASTKFKGVSEAYEILSDPEKKSKYDNGVEVEDIDNPHASAGGGGGFHGGHGGPGGIDPNLIFQMFMQQQHGGGGGMRFG